MSLLSEQLANATNEDVSAKILQNAKCSLRHGIEHFNDQAGRSTGAKYAIIHIAHAVELILKGLLARHDRLLLVAKVNTDGHVFTVDVIECCKRLRKGGIVDLSREEENRVILLRDLRNDIEHFAPVATVDTMRNTAVSLLSLCCAFMKNYAKLKLKDFLDHEHMKTVIEADKKFKDIITVADEELQKFIEKQKSKGKKRLYKGICRLCGQERLVHDSWGSYQKCFYCGFELKIDFCDQCGQNKILEYITSQNKWLCGLCKKKTNLINPEQV